MAPPQSSTHKKTLWILWVLTALSTTLMSILLLVTFANLNAVKHYVPGSQLSGVLAATLLASIFCLLLIIIAFFILLRQTTWAWRKQSSSFAYAFITATYLNLSFFLLITGIVLISNHHWIGDTFEQEGSTTGWSSGDTSAYNGAKVMCFITTGLYIIACIGLLFLEKAAVNHRCLDDLQVSLRGDIPLSNLSTPGSARIASTSTTPAIVVQPATEPPDSPPSAYRESVAAASKNRGAWLMP